MASERCSFVADAFHEAAVTGNDEDVVIMQLGTESRT